MSEHHRYNFLDSSRGLAAFVVLLAHTIKTFSPENFNSPFNLLWDSEAAVLYFFVLSGFVLTESLLEKKLSLHSYLNYLSRRLLRIFPGFLVVLLTAFLVFPFFEKPGSGWLMNYWKEVPSLFDLMKQAILIIRIPNDPALRILPHDWTLSIEILISLALPFIAWTAKKNILLLLIVIIGMVKILPIDPFIFDFTLGSIMATQKELLRKAWKKMSNLGHVFIPLIGLVLIKLDRFLPIEPKLIDHFLIHFKTWGIVLLLFSLISSKLMQNFLENKYFVFQGKISYSFYLIHLILIAILFRFQPDMNLFLALFVTSSITIILSTGLYFSVEKPCIQLGKKYFSGQKGQ